MDDNENLVALRAHLLELLFWAREEPAGMSIVLGNRLSISELDHEGIPWEDDSGIEDQVRAAVECATKRGHDPKPLLMIFQPTENVENTLTNAMVCIDLLLAVGDQPTTGVWSSEKVAYLKQLIERLSGNQAIVYSAMTTEYKSAKTIAREAGRTYQETRRALSDLKNRELVEHIHKTGYRKHHLLD